MSARKSFAGALAAVVAGSALVMTASPASAAYTPDPDDPGFTPVAADLIGAGSDTTQHAMKLIADVWNADASHGFKIASYAATSGGTIPLPGSPEITRPNGSGAGKGTLYNPSNPQIDFARSSDKLSAAESNAGLKAIPFALDTVVTAVSNQTPSNAPATLSAAQLVSIYKCESTTWSQVGGASGATIKPYAPQSGSGTAKFFKTTLVAANGGTDFNYGVCVTQDDTVQEHDDTLIKGNANAIVPISKGRAELKGGTVRVVGGFAEKRALYNVVRSAQATDASLQAVFGENGFVHRPPRPIKQGAGSSPPAPPAPAARWSLDQQLLVNQRSRPRPASARPARRTPSRWSPRWPAPPLRPARCPSTRARPSCRAPSRWSPARRR